MRSFVISSMTPWSAEISPARVSSRAYDRVRSAREDEDEDEDEGAPRRNPLVGGGVPEGGPEASRRKRKRAGLGRVLGLPVRVPPQSREEHRGERLRCGSRGGTGDGDGDGGAVPPRERIRIEPRHGFGFGFGVGAEPRRARVEGRRVVFERIAARFERGDERRWFVRVVRDGRRARRRGEGALEGTRRGPRTRRRGVGDECRRRVGTPRPLVLAFGSSGRRGRRRGRRRHGGFEARDGDGAARADGAGPRSRRSTRVGPSGSFASRRAARRDAPRPAPRATTTTTGPAAGPAAAARAVSEGRARVRVRRRGREPGRGRVRLRRRLRRRRRRRRRGPLRPRVEFLPQPRALRLLNASSFARPFAAAAAFPVSRHRARVRPRDAAGAERPEPSRTGPPGRTPGRPRATECGRATTITSSQNRIITRRGRGGRAAGSVSAARARVS